MALPEPIYHGPDWHSQHIPAWKHFLAPLVGQPCYALEIGSYEGRSARWLLDNVLTHESAELTCIDTFDDPDRLKRFRSNAYCDRPVQMYAGKSSWWLPRLAYSAPFDFIYIDGSHEAPDVLFDAVLSFEMLKPGGLLCFDDYAWSASLDGGVHAPKLAIDAFCTTNKERLTVLHANVQVWIRKNP